MSYHFSAQLVVIAIAAGALDGFWSAYASGPHRVEGLPVTHIRLAPADDPARLWAAFVATLSPSEAALLLVLTDSEPLQRLAVSTKLARARPTVVMRWWDGPASLEKNYRNRLVFNRYTGINFLPSWAAMAASREVPRGRLMLDNPVLLDQRELLGEDAAFKVMRHTLAALVQPQRTDIFGRAKRNHGHLRLTVATHFYCNQDNIETIAGLLRHYAGYPREILDRVQFVVVDDGSPVRYEVPDLDLNLTWVRIDQDIRWNQAGARNLALLQARSNNVIISDVDHLFPPHTLSWLTGRNVAHKRFYKFFRKMPDGTLERGHPNIFYLSRARWFQLFGTDEEFAGAYGAEDYRFVKTFKNHGTVQSHLPKRFYCEDRVLDRVKSYHSLVRDLSFNTGVDTRKRMEADWFGADYSHSRHNFNYTWTVLADRDRREPLAPAFDRSWRPRWLLRQFSSLVCGC
jgi:hypothetical protein